MKKSLLCCATSVLAIALVIMGAYPLYAAQNDSREILKQGLLGAGVGAISAEASGGKAGTGALVGAGTSVLGNVLLDALTGPSSSAPRRSSAPPQEEEGTYYTDETEDYYYEEPPQESSTQKVLKQGLLGAGVGAISAGASGGNAGQGALIGAGTNVLGSALLDTITEQPQTRRGRVYRKIPAKTAPQPQPQQQYKQQTEEKTTEEGTRKKIIRKFDESGKVVSEEEIYY